MKHSAHITIFLMLIGSFAYGETYSWVDDTGSLVFSDNPQSVPKKKRVRVRESVAAEKRTSGSIDEGAANKAPPVPSVPVLGTLSDDNREYGGKLLSSWRTDFDAARQEIKRLNAELDVVRGKIVNPSNLSRAEYLAANKKLRELESQAIKMQGGLMKLKKEATVAGVPVMIRGE